MQTYVKTVKKKKKKVITCNTEYLPINGGSKCLTYWV